jgi:hypothetical protein
LDNGDGRPLISKMNTYKTKCYQTRHQLLKWPVCIWKNIKLFRRKGNVQYCLQGMIPKSTIKSHVWLNKSHPCLDHWSDGPRNLFFGIKLLRWHVAFPSKISQHSLMYASCSQSLKELLLIIIFPDKQHAVLLTHGKTIHRLNFERLNFERPNFVRPNFERPNFERLNFERLNFEKDPTSKLNFEFELRKTIYSWIYMEYRQNAKTTKPILLDSLYKAVFTYMDWVKQYWLGRFSIYSWIYMKYRQNI